MRNETNKIEISERITERLVRVHENSMVLGAEAETQNELPRRELYFFVMCLRRGAFGERSASERSVKT